MIPEIKIRVVKYINFYLMEYLRHKKGFQHSNSDVLCETSARMRGSNPQNDKQKDERLMF